MKKPLLRSLKILILALLALAILAPAHFLYPRLSRRTEEGWLLLPIASGGVICQNLRYWRNGWCYVDERVYDALRGAARALRSEFPGTRIAYLDASGARRGPLKKHRSHSDGLNIDVQYLGITPSGAFYPSRPLWSQTGYAMKYMRDGRCGSLCFDAQRNWRFLMALREHSPLTVQAIFVEPYIREWLLKEGARLKADAAALAWARAKLMNAGTGPRADHKDHFHIRFSGG